MGTQGLALSNIVDVIIQVSAIAQTAPTFNIGAISGSTASSITHAQRGIVVTAANALLTAGFNLSSPEYIAAEIYFSQSPPPQSLYVVYQDPSSLKTVNPHSGNAGTGYAIGDVVAVVQGGNSTGQCAVATIGGSGAVTSLAPVTLTDGTGYTIATALATTTITGTGTGLEVDIAAIGETPLAALANARAVLSQWYGYYSCTAIDADNEAMGLFAQASQPPMELFWNSATAGIPVAIVTNDVASYMKAAEYERAPGIYSTTQGGFAPNNIYAGAALMGEVMGLNTGLAGSYFTAWGKPLAGIIPEPITQTQYNAIAGKNCNVYTNFGSFPLVSPGKMPNGYYIDLVIFLDVLTANITYNLMNLLTSLPALPITDTGEQQAIHQVNLACQQMVDIGFLSPGIWNGVTLLNLSPGDPVAAGYLCQALPVAQLSAGARAARQLQPIYLAIICSDAAQMITVAVMVQA